MRESPSGREGVHKRQVYNANWDELVSTSTLISGSVNQTKVQGRDEVLMERGTVGISFRDQREDCL